MSKGIRERLNVCPETLEVLAKNGTLFSIASSLTHLPAPSAAVYANLSEAYASSSGW